METAAIVGDDLDAERVAERVEAVGLLDGKGEDVLVGGVAREAVSLQRARYALGVRKVGGIVYLHSLHEMSARCM